jgi:hypothetical protein
MPVELARLILAADDMQRLDQPEGAEVEGGLGKPKSSSAA